MKRFNNSHQAERSDVLEGAPLHYALENERGVVYLFSHHATRQRFVLADAPVPPFRIASRGDIAQPLHHSLGCLLIASERLRSALRIVAIFTTHGNLAMALIATGRWILAFEPSWARE